MIVDPNGKEVKSIRFLPCPKCGRPPSDRVPSGGFGTEIYLICPCNYDFNKELAWQRATL